MTFNLHFVAFMAVALLAFVFVLRVALKGRSQRPPWARVAVTACVVVVGGMVFAKLGQNAGLQWWVYYTVPMLAAVLGPPLVFRMNRREILVYLVLSFLSSPIIHAVFSFLLGWKEYMPFIRIPAFWEL